MPRRSEPRRGRTRRRRKMEGRKEGRERRGSFSGVRPRALRIVSLIATFGRLCVEPTSSTRVRPSLSLFLRHGVPARIPLRLNPPRARGSNGRGADYHHHHYPSSSPPHRSFFFFFLPFSFFLFPFRLSPAAARLEALNSPAAEPRRTTEKGAPLFSPKLSLRALFVALDA